MSWAALVSAAVAAGVVASAAAARTCEVSGDTLVSCAGFAGAELDVSSYGIVELSPAAFEGLDALEALHCGYNAISELPAGVFEPLARLQTLRLHVTSLAALPAGVFDALTQLRVLVLSFGALTELPAGVFDRLGQLEVLDLSFNSLQALPAGVFSGLLRLKRLWLQGNRLGALPPELGGLPSLVELFVFDNPALGPLCVPGDAGAGGGGCAGCPAGYEPPVSVGPDGAPLCLPCAFGPACRAECAPGTVMAGAVCVEALAAPAAPACAPGTYAVPPPGAGGPCAECPAGYACGGGAAPVAPCACDAGYASITPGVPVCAGLVPPCVAVAGHAARAGDPAPRDPAAAASCGGCAPGSHAAAAAAAAAGGACGVCVECPRGFECPGGLAEPERCACAPGRFSDAVGSSGCGGAGGTCVVCPDGHECAGGDVQPSICAGGVFQVAAGTHCEPCTAGTRGRVPGAARGCPACPRAARCVGGNACAAGAAGDLCEFCREGYYSEGGACTGCPAAPLRVAVGVFVLATLLVGAAGGTAAQAAAVGCVQAVQVLQLLVTVTSFDAPWGPFGDAMRAHAAVVGSFGLSSLACGPMGARWSAVGAVGAVCAVCALAAAVALWAARGRPCWRRSMEAAFSTAAVLLAAPALRFFVSALGDCARVGEGGGLVLASSPGIACSASDPVFVGLLLLCAGAAAAALLLLPSDVRRGTPAACDGGGRDVATLPSLFLKPGAPRFDLWSLRWRCVLVLVSGLPAGLVHHQGVVQGAAAVVLGLGYARVVATAGPYVHVTVPLLGATLHEGELSAAGVTCALGAVAFVLPALPGGAARDIAVGLFVGVPAVSAMCCVLVCACAAFTGGGRGAARGASADDGGDAEAPSASAVAPAGRAAAGAGGPRAPRRRTVAAFGALLLGALVFAQWYAMLQATPGHSARAAAATRVASGEEPARVGSRALVAVAVSGPAAGARAVPLAEKPVGRVRAITDRGAQGFSQVRAKAGGTLDVIALATELVLWRRAHPALAGLLTLFDACAFHACTLPPLRVPAPMPVVHDFERWRTAWASVRAGPYEFKSFEPMEPTMPMPADARDVPRALQRHTWSSTAPASVAVFTDVCVSGIGHVFVDNVALSPLRGCEYSGEPMRYYDAKTVYEEAVSIGQWWFENYYHFFTEALGRMALVAPYLRAHPHVQVLATTLADQAFTLELLEFMGIARGRVHLAACARRLLLPEPMSCGRPSLTHLLALRSEVLRGLHGRDPPHARPAPPVYDVLLIHRSQWRRITNFWELYAALCGLGARIGLFHGGLSAREGFALWGASRMVVADHGAGLSNMVAAHAPFTVVEFQTLRIHRRAYERMATLLGYRYIGFSPEGATDESGGAADVAAVVRAVAEELGVDPDAPPAARSTSECSAAVDAAHRLVKEVAK